MASWMLPVVVAFALAASYGCGPEMLAGAGPLARTVSEPSTKSSVFVALGNEESSGSHTVWVSTREMAATTAYFCETTSPSECRAGAKGYRTTKEQAIGADVRAFRADAPTKLRDGMSLSVVMVDAGGREVTTARVDLQDRTSSRRGSGGRGGAFGYSEPTFAASNGKASKFKIAAPSDAGSEKAYGLLVYLHGDVGGDYEWEWKSIRRVAEERQLIPVAVLSPTKGDFGSSGYGPTWWKQGDENAVFLDELLKQAVLAKYNIDTRKIYFTGQSGGPVFLNSAWIRHYAHQYRGGSLIFCGGWTSTKMSFEGDAEFIKGYPINVYVGTDDHNYEWARSAIKYYRGKGFQVFAEHPPIGHCAWNNFGELLAERLDVQMSERFVGNDE